MTDRSTKTIKFISEIDDFRLIVNALNSQPAVTYCRLMIFYFEILTFFKFFADFMIFSDFENSDMNTYRLNTFKILSALISALLSAGFTFCLCD